ncbi:hypothetical protein SARC_06480 [Sphaeroforma arctica JP610]|uniref:Transcription factor CBF/NF-Y/archaeal histone domain-containing protein n=1 Tax=Sphaeroforma arctica JP610 TaxID=667725 RepID=A0A0L0FWK5_9EUKA|nr:hypothetical protein SARC_06480 [Sphaeroforma arctica JP610]KNC81197.1 hypothetical protein SARC_06480 [Sphaeroforma arctica JP610]|eukprot:XP_014155099.1 hypothetical protein SARC_06480 [Sphaeroforma arctica JP610]
MTDTAATVYKIIKELMPNEFIHLIASESNEVCGQSGKKTIGPDHVIEGLKNLGFQHYLANVNSVLEDHKEEKTIRSKKKAKGKHSGVSAEELLAQQRALFAKARARSDSQVGPALNDSAPASLNSLAATPAGTVSAVSGAEATVPEAQTHMPAPSLLKKEYDEDEDYD